MSPPVSLALPELEDFQWSYNGLTMGANTPYGVLKVEGLDLAKIRSGDVNWSRDHGQQMGLDLYEDRDVILDLWMKSDGTSLQHAQLALATATIVRLNEELPLWFKLPEYPVLCIMCRPRKRPMKIDSDYAAAKIGKPELSLHATDPRIYGAGEATLLQLTTANPYESTAEYKRGEIVEAGSGGPWECIFPCVGIEPEVTPEWEKYWVHWLGKRLRSELTITNNGNTEMRPILVFNGPFAIPRIVAHSLAGEPFLKFLAPGIEPETGGKTLKAGEQLEVNLDPTHRITWYAPGEKESGALGTDVSQWLNSESTWWDLIPGENLIEIYSEYTADDTGSVEVLWAPAYEI
jgi:hypothetical protein